MEKYDDKAETTDVYEKPVITDHGTLVDLTAVQNGHGGNGEGFLFPHHHGNWFS